jgi:hypothetical protein
MQQPIRTSNTILEILRQQIWLPNTLLQMLHQHIEFIKFTIASPAWTRSIIKVHLTLLYFLPLPHWHRSPHKQFSICKASKSHGLPDFCFVVLCWCSMVVC